MGKLNLPLEIDAEVIDAARRQEKCCAVISIFDPRTKAIDVFVGLVGHNFMADMNGALQRSATKLLGDGEFTEDDDA